MLTKLSHGYDVSRRDIHKRWLKMPITHLHLFHFPDFFALRTKRLHGATSVAPQRANL